MRLHRGRRRRGILCVRINLHATQIDGLVQLGVLRQEERNDPVALAWAIDALIDKALDDPV